MRILELLSLGAGLILFSGCQPENEKEVTVHESNWVAFPSEEIIEDSEIVTIPVDNRRGDALIVQTVERSVSEGELISFTKE